MDLSKLPQSSDATPPPPNPPPQVRPIGPEVWFNVVVGLLLIYMGRTFARWLAAVLTGHSFHTGFTFGPGGPEVPYFQLQGYTAWTQAGMFLFGLAVLFEAAVMLLGSIRPLVLLALGLCALSTLWNLIVCFILMANGQIPLLSALAVAFGGYILATLLTALRRA